MSADILNEFIFDAREHLGTAGAQLLSLEKDPGSLEALNALMGTMHTIKGNSGFVGLQNLYSLMHRSESLLQTVREVESFTCPPKVVDQLFQVLDTAEAVLDRLENGDDDVVDWMEALNQALGEAEEDLEQRAKESKAGANGLGPAVSAASAAVSEAPAAPAKEAGRKAAAEEVAEDVTGQIKVVSLSNGQLAKEGDKFLNRGEALFKAGLTGIVVDLRSVSSFSSTELGFLIALHKNSGGRVGLVIDEKGQEAFFRVFQVLFLDRFLKFFPDEKTAAAALQPE